MCPPDALAHLRRSPPQAADHLKVVHWCQARNLTHAAPSGATRVRQHVSDLLGSGRQSEYQAEQAPEHGAHRGASGQPPYPGGAVIGLACALLKEPPDWRNDNRADHCAEYNPFTTERGGGWSCHQRQIGAKSTLIEPPNAGWSRMLRGSLGHNAEACEEKEDPNSHRVERSGLSNALVHLGWSARQAADHFMFLRDSPAEKPDARSAGRCIVR